MLLRVVVDYAVCRAGWSITSLTVCRRAGTPTPVPANAGGTEDHVRFVVGDTKGGQASWWLYADNNEMVAWVGETFDSTSHAKRAATAFKTGALTARYEVYADTGSQPRWRAWRSSDKVAASGESFSSQGAASCAAENVRDNAGAATGP